jgi:hypothetical protein
MFDSLSHALDDDEIEIMKKKKIEQEEKSFPTQQENSKKEIKSTDIIEIITNNNFVSLSENCFFLKFFQDLPPNELSILLEKEKPMNRFQTGVTSTLNSFLFESKVNPKLLPTYPTPLQKIYQNLKEKNPTKNLLTTFCVILYFNEFSPIKKEDLLILEKVKEYLALKEFQVVGAFLIPLKEIESKEFQPFQRIEMCKLISNESSWIETDQYSILEEKKMSKVDLFFYFRDLIQNSFKIEFEDVKILNLCFQEQEKVENINHVIVNKENVDITIRFQFINS